jgi:hypothetical protein
VSASRGCPEAWRAPARGPEMAQNTRGGEMTFLKRWRTLS